MSCGQELQNIIKEIKKNSIKFLSLGLSIDDAGMKDLSDALKYNTSIKTISFYENGFGPAGVQYLAAALRENKTVQNLWLRYVRFGVAGVKAMADLLTFNNTLENVCLNQGKLDYDSLVDNIKEFILPLGINKKLVSLRIDSRKLNFFYKEFGLPHEFREKSEEDVLNFLRERNASSLEVCRMKVLIVGTGGVGKTTLVKRLTTGVFSGSEPWTDGLNTQEWLEPESKIQFSLWDFGGQQIFFNTHRLFFSYRSLFVVMWNPLVGNEETSISHLRTVHSFHPKAPVLLVSSHANKVTVDGDSVIEKLKKYHPNILGYFAIDSENGAGVDEFKKGLAEFSLQQDHVRQNLPSSYVRLEEKLKSSRSDHFSISLNEFQYTLRSVGLDESHTALVLDLFHAWGVIHCLPGENSDIVLNPQDLADVFRCVITFSSVRPGQIVYKDGILPHDHLKEIWDSDEKKYPEHLWLQFLKLLFKCNLAFPLYDGTGFALEKSLIPSMLSDLTFKLDHVNFERNIIVSCLRRSGSDQNLDEHKQNFFSIIVKFDFLPCHFFPRLLVSLRSLTVVGGAWSNCCLLYKQDVQDCMVCILVYEEMKELSIRIISINDSDGNICLLATTAIANLRDQHFPGSLVEKVKLKKGDNDLLNEKQLKKYLEEDTDSVLEIGNQFFPLNCLMPVLATTTQSEPLFDVSESFLFQGEMKDLLKFSTGFENKASSSKVQVRLDLQRSILKYFTHLNSSLHGISKGLNALWIPIMEEGEVRLVAVSVNRDPKLPWILVPETKFKLFSYTAEFSPSRFCNDFDLLVIKKLFEILFWSGDERFNIDLRALSFEEIDEEDLDRFRVQMIKFEGRYFTDPEESAIFGAKRSIVFANNLSKGMISLETLNLKIDKQSNLLKDVVKGHYKAPSHFLLLPPIDSTEKITSNWFYGSMRLVFFCPINFELMECGPDGTGYDIVETEQWVKNTSWFVKNSIDVLRLASVAFDLNSLLKISAPNKDILDLMYNSISEGSENKVLHCIKQTMEVEPYELKCSYEALHQFLWDCEMKDKKIRYDPSWLPKWTGLHFTISDKDGTSAWLSKKKQAEFHEKGMELLQKSTPDKAVFKVV